MKTKKLKLNVFNCIINQVSYLFMAVLLTNSFYSCHSKIKTETQVNDSIVYKSDAFSIYSHSVSDTVYGGDESPALIPNDTTIYSPVRVIPKGKTVVLDTSSWWHPVSEIRNFPKLITKHASINVTYNLALDILYRCSSGEFMRNEGEEGMWQAGFRRGEGYGVWTRDVCYTGLWMGSFLDTEVAKKSIEYVTLKGIDNGEDGLAMPAIAVWNHFEVTGDSSIIKNTYENLKVQVGKIEYHEERNLGFAKSGSFIDSGSQPEAGGFPLSTNILYAEAYRAMSIMGKMMGDSQELTDMWGKRAELMKETIREEYWNSEAGYYTLGPKGSESYEMKHWENLGQSLAIWPKWGIADQEKRTSVLNHKDGVFNQYGFTDLNYVRHNEDPKSLHGLQVWIFTEVGEVVAMAHEKQVNEVLHMLATAIRTATIHKTFRECVDWKTGKGWRYPGQLWHAVGFMSMIYYGTLGMDYNENGISFSNACVPESFADMKIENFKYRNATLNIEVSGYGVFNKLMLDGEEVASIPSKIKGKHTIKILLK